MVRYYDFAIIRLNEAAEIGADVMEKKWSMYRQTDLKWVNFDA